MGRGARGGRIGRGGGIGASASATGYYPAAGAPTAAAAAVSYTSPPQPRFIYQTNPTLAAASPVAAATASPQFYPTTPTAAYFDAATPKRPGEEQQLNMPATAAALVEVPAAAHPGASVATVKATKNSVQVGCNTTPKLHNSALILTNIIACDGIY